MTKQHRVIRTDGTEEILDHRPSSEEIRRLIGCDFLDVVTVDRRLQTVMYVDDIGMIDGKPVNAKATTLYHAVCRPGNYLLDIRKRRHHRRERQIMTDITKALSFAKECLGWEHAVPSKPNAIFIEDLSLNRFMSLDSIEDFQTYLSSFLGQRFFIQINRGTSSLFKWSVIVGLQNRSAAPPVHEHGRGGR